MFILVLWLEQKGERRKGASASAEALSGHLNEGVGISDFAKVIDLSP
jgi:hypothetical protein